jgi:hypothetical protein
MLHTTQIEAAHARHLSRKTSPDAAIGTRRFRTPQDEHPSRWGSAVRTGRVSDCRLSALRCGAAANVGEYCTSRVKGWRESAGRRIHVPVLLERFGKTISLAGELRIPVCDRPRGLLKRDACGSVSRTRATAPR